MNPDWIDDHSLVESSGMEGLAGAAMARGRRVRREVTLILGRRVGKGERR